jgi:hypothetical protein
MASSNYRLGVTDGPGVATLYFERESYRHAFEGWRILADYGRDGVGATIEVRRDDGEWVEVDPTTGEAQPR